MTVPTTPTGYHSVTPYISVSDANRLIDFMVEAFGAEVTERMTGPDGRVGHAEVRIGDSMIMLTDASERLPAMITGIYLYVPDADATYKKALSAGGTSLTEPADQFYGDRSGGVTDPTGNQWWIATHIEDVGADELGRRFAQVRG